MVMLLILFSKGRRRLVTLMLGVLFLNDTISIQPFSSYTLLITTCFLSLTYHRELKYTWYNFPFKTIFVILFIIHFLVVQFDNRSFPPLTFISRVFNNYVPHFLALFVGYAAISSIKVWKKSAMPMALIFSIMCIYGFITFVLQNNPYDDMLHMAFGNELGIWHDVQSRGYRVFSTLNKPNVYGYVMFLAATYLYLQRKLLNKTLYVVVTLMIILNAFLSNSRTGIVSGALMIAIYIILEYKLSYKVLGYSAGMFILLIILYDYVPFIQPIADSVIDVFTTGGVNTSGSTTDLKGEQLTSSLFFFFKHPYFGNGFNYFQEVIGVQYDTYDIGLAGLEGYGYKLLVEEGAFMIIAVTWLFISMLLFFIRRFEIKECSSMSVAWIVSLLFFMFLTGIYGGIYTIGMIFIGMILRYVQIDYDEKFPVSKSTKNHLHLKQH